MEVDLGEIPDELADPIMGTLMRNPVKLPSGHVVDREVFPLLIIIILLLLIIPIIFLVQVIMQQLLSAGPINPFNRSELREDQLIPGRCNPSFASHCNPTNLSQMWPSRPAWRPGLRRSSAAEARGSDSRMCILFVSRCVLFDA